MTSADDQVFAVNGATGDMLWHYAPDNLASFKNYGIVANRGVADCDGKVFLLTLDMTIVALDPATGQQLDRVADRTGGSRGVRELRLLGDERPDLRQPHGRDRRGRLGVRRSRLRDGVPHRPDTGLGESVLDDPAGRDASGGARRSSLAAQRTGRRRRST